MIIDALKSKYPLPDLLKWLGLPKSSYYYQEAVQKKPDKYSDIRNQIRQLFHENKQRYGYRRIYGLLKREECTISEKVIHQIMREEGLIAICKRCRKYNSYQGEISPDVPNKIERDFHADKPNQKWLTDITEFALPAGKVYLSVLVDCFLAGQSVLPLILCLLTQCSTRQSPICRKEIVRSSIQTEAATIGGLVG